MHYAGIINVEDLCLVEHELDRLVFETDEQYMEFYDATDDIKYDYETRLITAIRLGNGKIISERDLSTKLYKMKDGKVYAIKENGGLTENARTMSMTIIENYPAKDVFKTYRSFAARYSDYEYYQKYKRFGKMYNPSGICDWCSEGGRFSEYLLVKTSVDDVLELSKNKKQKHAPRGYKWVYGAKACEIEWEMMKKLQIHNGIRDFEKCSRMYLSGDCETWYDADYNNRVLKLYGEVIYRADDSLKSFLDRNGYYTDIHCNIKFSHFIDDGEIMSREEDRHTWYKNMDKIICNCKPNSYFVVVDFHM